MKYKVMRGFFAAGILAILGVSAVAAPDTKPVSTLDQSADASGAPYTASAVMGYPPSTPDEQESYPAPDGHAAVRPKGVGGDTRWYIHTSSADIDLYTETWPFPEFLWAPDSKALAVTYSDGGSMGNFYLGVYLLSSPKSKAVDVTAAAQQDFLAQLPKSYDSAALNLAAVSWLDGSRHLLVAVEVVPESTYAYMGTFALYEVSVPDGKIKIGRASCRERV